MLYNKLVWFFNLYNHMLTSKQFSKHGVAAHHHPVVHLGVLLWDNPPLTCPLPPSVSQLSPLFSPFLLPNLCDNASSAGITASRGGEGVCQNPMSLSTNAQSAENAQESAAAAGLFSVIHKSLRWTLCKCWQKAMDYCWKRNTTSEIGALARSSKSANTNAWMTWGKRQFLLIKNFFGIKVI